MPLETPTAHSYPTVADKVRLFRENGIDARDYFAIREDAPGQAIRFPERCDSRRRAVDIAIRYGLPIIELSYKQDYDGKKPHGIPYNVMLFRREKS